MLLAVAKKVQKRIMGLLDTFVRNHFYFPLLMKLDRLPTRIKYQGERFSSVTPIQRKGLFLIIDPFCAHCVFYQTMKGHKTLPIVPQNPMETKFQNLISPILVTNQPVRPLR